MKVDICVSHAFYLSLPYVGPERHVSPFYDIAHKLCINTAKHQMAASLHYAHV
jgi:hypothetical protein